MAYIPTRTPKSDGKDTTTSYKPISMETNEEDVDQSLNKKTSISDLKRTSSFTSIHSPKTLKPRSKKLTSIAVNAIAIATTIAILAFAFTSYGSNGNVMGSQERRLLEAARIIATAFPYIFAVILGKTIQSAISWRLENGLDGISFAYLSRSLTLGGACTVPVHLRCVHWLPAILIIIWAASPLGSQALLRFVSVKSGSRSNQLREPLTYAYPTATFESACAGTCEAEGHSSIFMAPFYSLATNRLQYQDVWGNLKIPLFDDVDYTSSPDGWLHLDPLAETQFTALIGIPFTKPPSTGNTSFLVQSWYWDLENATRWGNTSMGTLLTAKTEYNGSTLLSNYSGASSLWQFAIPAKLLDTQSVSNIPLTFEVDCTGLQWGLNSSAKYSFDNTTIDMNDRSETIKKAVRLDALLTQKFVELNVTCTPSACVTIDIRQIAMDPTYPARRASDMGFFRTFFLYHLVRAFPSGHINYGGALEAYLYDPTQNPFSVLGAPHDFFHTLTPMDARTLAVRLSQIINTFWIVDQEFTNVIGAFGKNLAEGFKGTMTQVYVRNATVTSLTAEDIFYCDYTWFAMLCIATFVMLSAAVASPVIESFQLAPDSTDFLSALTLKGGRDMMEGGTYLDLDERTRLLKDIVLKIGDGRPEDDEVGKIVIGRETEVCDLRKGRLYE